jgi:uncharacterized iron-regulated membrane protein
MTSPTPSTPAAGALYRAIWRWHFYAGLIVAPVLLVLAITGSIYLFNSEIEDWLHHDRRFVTAQGAAMPATHSIAAAQEAQPGLVVSITMPATPDRPAEVAIKPATGEAVQVAVEPATMTVLGTYVTADTLVGLAREIHRSLTIGTLGRGIVELAACWTLVMIATGLYLWWPRGAAFHFGGVFFPRVWLRGRALLKDIHAVTGVWVAALIVFMVLTGLPWAGVQGGIVRQGVTAMGIGYPPRGAQSVPMQAVVKDAPWTLADAAMPKSTPASEHAGHAGHEAAGGGADGAAVEGVDRITDALWAMGITGGYRLTLPAGPTGVYTASIYPDQPQGQRTLHFDRYSGRLIKDVGYADYGWGAKAIELGVQLHMGNYFGRANQILMLLPCIGIVLLVFSGLWMWWKRRPAGRLGAPPKVPDASVKGALGLLALAGVLLPLFGASLIAVFALDRIMVALKPKAA